MALRKRPYSEQGLPHGIVHVNVREWGGFAEYVSKELSAYPSFIYRGHASGDWLLEASLDRVFRRKKLRRTGPMRAQHLLNFKQAARGRRGLNPAQITEDNDWWALGRHQGLATPLLDWTESPYVAAFFAYEERSQQARRVIYGMDSSLVEEQSSVIARAHDGAGRAPIVELFRPMQDENARLVSQRGLFTRAPAGMDIESWIRLSFPEDYAAIVLVRLTLPNADRVAALRDLNRMNINRISLFPDLGGAAAYCNTFLEVDNY